MQMRAHRAASSATPPLLDGVCPPRGLPSQVRGQSITHRTGDRRLREDIALASLGVPSARSATHPSPRAIVAHRTNASPAQHRRADQFSPTRPRPGSLREDT